MFIHLSAPISLHGNVRHSSQLMITSLQNRAQNDQPLPTQKPTLSSTCKLYLSFSFLSVSDKPLSFLRPYIMHAWGMQEPTWEQIRSVKTPSKVGAEH
jgi:hypothetical protein